MSERVFSATGAVSDVNGRTVVTTQPGEAGCVLYGPYVELERGRYEAVFVAAIVGEAGGDAAGAVCCAVDACTEDGQRIVARREVTGAELVAGGRRLTLPFEVDAPGTYEFRFFSTGRAALAVLHDRTLTGQAAGDAGGVRPVEHDAFSMAHAAAFRHLVKAGGEITRHREGTQVRLLGTRVWVRNAEDFQIINEVLVRNEYAFALREPCCVLDVGMNVGLASLYFAGLGHVAEVHAFEPFAAPYGRALENFAINPEVAGKITAHPFGLGGRDEEPTVLYDADHTIGVSMRGSGHGAPVTIRVRDAATIVAGHLARAKAAGQRLVVKLDCEGAEFPIFDRLIEAGLLGEVSVFLIEWHKWWSAERTQRDLVEPLLERGFAVLDQTDVMNPHAGSIYAVRMRG